MSGIFIIARVAGKMASKKIVATSVSRNSLRQQKIRLNSLNNDQSLSRKANTISKVLFEYRKLTGYMWLKLLSKTIRRSVSWIFSRVLEWSVTNVGSCSCLCYPTAFVPQSGTPLDYLYHYLPLFYIFYICLYNNHQWDLPGRLNSKSWANFPSGILLIGIIHCWTRSYFQL